MNRASLHRTASAACRLILFAAFIKGTALGQVRRPSSFRLSELDNMTPVERRLAAAIIKGDLPEAKAAADDVRLPQLQGFQEFLLATGGESNAEVVTYFRDAYRLGITDLKIAVMSGDVDRVRELLRGVERDESGVWGRGSDPHSELLLAIARKDANMVQVLLQSGADPNSAYGDAPSSDNTRNPQTPLKHAIRLGNTEIVKLLLAAGAEVEEARVCRSIVENPSAADRERVDQLMLGKADGRKLTPKEHSAESNALLAAGILRESIREDANLYGPMVLAIEMGRESIVDALLDGGADPNVPIGKATTPLHKAVEAGHPGIVQRLIDKGAKVNALDSAGRTPIEYVYSPGALRGDILDILMKAGGKWPEARQTASLKDQGRAISKP